MGYQSVTWVSAKLLPCAGCVPADVILCIGDPTKIAPRDCPVTGAPAVATEETAVKHTIIGQIVQTVRFKNSCAQVYYRYTITYDATQLATGAVIYQNDITGVLCKGCLTDYIAESAGAPIKLESIPASGETPAKLRLTNQFGCTFEFNDPSLANLAVNCTLAVDEITGILGIPVTAEDAGGHVSLLGFDSEGCSVRVTTPVVYAEMTIDSADFEGELVAENQLIVNFNQVTYDPDGLVTTGANWRVTIAKPGVYAIYAQTRWKNQTWGIIVDQTVAAQLFYRKNAEAWLGVGVQHAIPDTKQAPIVGSGMLLRNLVVGDTIQFSVDHSDVTAVHGILGQGATYFSLVRVGE